MFQITTILLTTDFSATSRKAVQPAVTLARMFNARIVLTHVGDFFPPVVEEYYVAVNLDEVRQQAHEQARKHLAEFAAQYVHQDGLTVELESPLGVAHVEICRVAAERGADLIVMATHGRGFISHAILGSTTERVLRRAPCAVLVVRADE
jgi:nucleotide-binding universal stress UspA family protein